MLTAYVSTNHKDWDDQLPFVMMAYRSSDHETTGMSPNMLMFGREFSTPQIINGFGNYKTELNVPTRRLDNTHSNQCVAKSKFMTHEYHMNNLILEIKCLCIFR